MANLETELPNNLIDLIELAISDARKCEKDPKYIMDMYKWHEPTYDNNTCSVCMAGAVIAQTLKLDIDKNFCEVKTDENLNNKLFLINDVREGFFSNIEMGKLNWRIPEINLLHYKLQYGDLEEWEKLLKDLKKEQKEYEKICKNT